MTPNELISAILRAPVELLWNGGIGTYVRAAAESDAFHGWLAQLGGCLALSSADISLKTLFAENPAK